MPVPDTGAPAAAGFAERSGIPYREGMVRNRYSGRTFIQPSQAMRQRGVNVKLSPLREVVRDRKLIVVDDSIVRGTTTKQIVGLLRRAGARRGPRPDQRPADLPPVLLRHRHLDRDRAHRLDPLRRGDPRVHRGGHARLPVDPRRAGRARPAVRAVLLRLLRRQLPRARPVRRQRAQVPARDRGQRGRPGDDAPRLRAVRRGRGRGRPGRVADAGGGRVDAPAGGPGRPRRVRIGVHDPRGRPRARDRVVDRRRGDEDRDRRARWAATTRSASTSSRCAPTTSCAPAPSRVAFLDYVAVGRPGPRERRRARGRRRRRLPAGGLRARRRRDGRAPGPDGGRRVRPRGVLHRDRRALAGSSTRPRPAPATRSSGSPRAASTRTATRSSAPSSPSTTSTSARRTRRCCAACSGTRRPVRPSSASRRHALATLGEVLLTPTRVYARDVLAIRAALAADGVEVRGIAHITGGGLPGNVPRVLPATLGARLRPSAWPMPSVMRLLGELGGDRGRRAARDVQRRAGHGRGGPRGGRAADRRARGGPWDRGLGGRRGRRRGAGRRAVRGGR